MHNYRALQSNGPCILTVMKKKEHSKIRLWSILKFMIYIVLNEKRI